MFKKTKLNLHAIFCLFLTVCSSSPQLVIGQTIQDTIDNPFFIEMMKDRSVNFYQTQRAAELWFNNRTRQRGDGWKPYKRWEWQAQQEVDANGNFPNTLTQDAQAALMKQQSFAQDAVVAGMSPTGGTCKNSGVWKEMGPGNLPANNTGQLNGLGRLNAVVVHPTDSNIIFAGSAAGGIWKTSDGGQSWSVYSDSLPTLGVSAIAIDPNTPNTMYFGSGDRDHSSSLGRGVFKSIDGGATWTASSTGMGNKEVARLIIDPSNTATLIAACNDGIYRSTNSGGSWTRTATGGYFKEVIFMPGNSNVVYAEQGGRFYRSLNNGSSFTLITAGLPTTNRTRGVIEVSALDSTLVYFWVANGSRNRGFYLSRDSATSFVTQSTTPNIHDWSTAGSGTGGQAWYNKDMAVDLEDAGVIYTGGVNIFKSTDTGKTWTISAYWVNTVHADHHELIADPLTKKIYTANDGGLYWTNDGGNNWTDVSNGLAIAQIYKIGASRTQKDILIAGFQDNGTGNFNNGWYTTRGGDGMDCEVDQEDNRYSYGALYYGNIFRVFNVNSQGTIAANGTNGITESGGWVTPYSLREGLSTTMYIGYKNIWRSTNVKTGTPTWTRITSTFGGNNMTEIESAIGNPDILYASRSNGQLHRSDNINATTPTFIQLTQPRTGTVRAIETDPDLPNTVYVSIGNRVYRSHNKGGSWTQINSTLPSNVQCILLDTSSAEKGLYVGTLRNGVWYTDTTLTIWKYYSTGLPATVSVTDLELYYEKDKDCINNVLYASTYNRGVWHSPIYQSTSRKPVARVEEYDSIICKDAVLSLEDNSCNIPTEWLWEFSPNTISYIEGDSSSEDIRVQFNAPGTYTFVHYAKNCNGYDSTIGSIIVGDTIVSACSPTTTNNFNSIGIFNFQMAGINRTSAGVGGEGEYIDLACTQTARVEEGNSYNVNVITGLYNDEQVKIWIDYNNDGDFTDAGELVWSPARARTNHSGSILIPNPAPVTGVILRMRVRTDYNAIANIPCGNVAYGQAEDYGLYIEPDSAEIKFIQNDTNLCAGEYVVFTDSTINGTGKTYTWSFGDGAIPATANTSGPHTVQYISSGYKKVVLYVGTDSLVKDSTVYVEPSPFVTIATIGNDSLLCAGESVQLQATDANASGATLQWQKDELSITDSTFSHYYINNSVSADSASYRVIATFGSCIDTSEDLTIHVYPKPTASFSTDIDSACFKGHSLTTTNNSSISNASLLNYLWTFGDGNSSLAMDTTFSYAMQGTYQVKLIVSSSQNCQDSASKSIFIKASPSIAATVNDSTQCFNGNAFTWTNSSSIASGTLTYQWTFGDGNSSSISSPTHSYLTHNDSFGVWLQATSDRACSDSLLFKAEVYPSPTVAFSINDSAQCENGNNYQFTNTSSIASGYSIAYQWNFGDGNSSTLNSPSKSYTSHGNFNVKLVGTSNDRCMDSSTQAVSVDPNTNIGFSLNQDSQCFVGNDFIIANNSSLAVGTYTASWDFGDASSSSLLNPANKTYSTFSNAYTIELITQTDKNCLDTLSKAIGLFENPLVDFSINDSAQCLDNNSFVFSNSSSIDLGTLDYDWDFDDGNSSILNNPTHSYSASNTNYMVKLIVMSDFGCSDSLSKTAIVHPEPVVEFTINDSTQCLQSNSMQLSNTSSISNGTISYLWNFGDGNTSASNSPLHTYIAVGNYTIKLVATSDNGCKDSFTKPVELYPSPTADFNISDFDQCFKGHEFILTNNSSIPTGTLNYDWDFGDGTTSTMVNVSSKVYSSFMDSATIQLVTRSAEGCIDSVSKKVYLFVDPIANFNVNDEHQCLVGNQFVFSNTSANVNAASTYNWDFDDGNSSVLENPSHTYLNEHLNRMVQLIVTSDQNCRDTQNLRVSIAPNPVANFSINDSTQCLSGNSFNFTEMGSISLGTYNLAFDFGDGNTSNNSPTNHSYASANSYNVLLTLTSDSGCTSSTTKNVEVYQMPSVDFTINDDEQCLEGNSFSFADISSGKGVGATSNWFLDGNLENNGTSYNTSFTVSEIGNHNVKLLVITSNACSDSIEKVVTVIEHPNIMLTGDDEVCLNEQVSLNASSSQASTNFTWNSSNGNAGTGNPINILGNTAGNINVNVQATNNQGCITDSSFTNRIMVNDLPVPVIDTTLVSLRDGVELAFIDATNIPIQSRTWQFIPSWTGSNPREVFILKDTATYQASLTLIDTNGCAGTTEESFFIVIPNNYYLPSAFTPNDDGLNDVFKIPGYINVQSFSMRIFNRWGEILFETTDPNQGWDGTANGIKVMDGTYGYMIEILDFNQKKIFRKGSITILR